MQLSPRDEFNTAYRMPAHGSLTNAAPLKEAQLPAPSLPPQCTGVGIMANEVYYLLDNFTF
jgi:hypothetical protein